MAIIEAVRCPNCGSWAERHHLSFLAQVKTECDRCDYLMVTCTRSGRVVEAYAPGLPFENFKVKKLAPLPLKQLTEARSDKVQELMPKSTFFSSKEVNKQVSRQAIS